MANELNQITVDSTGTSWVDSVPGVTSAGYQSQNTNITARTVGQDLSSVRVSGTDIIVDISGPIDIDGLPFSLTSEVTLTPSTGGVFYIQVISGATSIQKSLELTSDVPVWDASKNALYNGGNRVLNWVVYATSPQTRVVKLVDPKSVNSSLGSTDQTMGDFGFTRWRDLSVLTYPYYCDSFVLSTAGTRAICIMEGNLVSVGGSTITIYDGISNSISSTISLSTSTLDGVTYDYVGKNLIVSTVTTCYVLDGVSSTVLTSFSLTNLTWGLGFDGENLLSVDSDPGNAPVYIRIHDGISSTILTTITRSGEYYGSGCTFDGKNIIYGSNDSVGASTLTYVLRGESSGVHVSFTPFGASGYYDFGWDGKHLISFDYTNQKIYVHGFI